jgi:nucleotide-binding universal stress UspA family protein
LKEGDARDMKRAIEERVRELSSEPFEVLLSSGSAHSGLIDLASQHGAALLVVGASGAGTLRDALFGNTAANVARYAECPVLVARASADHGPVVVGTDFSDAVTPALHAAGLEAKKRAAELVLVHSMFEPGSPLDLLGPLVVSPPVPTTEAIEEQRSAALTTLKSLLMAHAADGRCIVVDEEPASALANQAAELGAQLVVVGTHGRTGLARIALGSVAEAVAEAAPCSVLVARNPN